MKNLMLLHNRHTPDDCDIWRVAMKRGWNTVRTSAVEIYLKENIKGYNFIRYYGNTLHAEMIKEHLPFTFTPINPWYLANLAEYTKRNISLVKFDDIKQPIQKECFIKPCGAKWFEAKVFHEGEFISGAPDASDDCYISDVVDYIDEVRCFVLDGEVLTSSLYRIDKQSYQEVENPEDSNLDDRIRDTPLEQYAQEIFEKCKGLPRAIVMDFGRLKNGTWNLIEFNEAWASGLYYCDPERCFEVIVESQIDR